MAGGQYRMAKRMRAFRSWSLCLTVFICVSGVSLSFGQENLPAMIKRAEPSIMESCKQAIRLKPDFALAHYNLGNCYTALKRYEEAIESCRQAIRIKPGFAEAHIDLSMTYLRTGDRGSALWEYKILRDLDKDLANKLFNLIYE